MCIQLKKEYLPVRAHNGLANYEFDHDYGQNKKSQKEKFKKNQEFHNPHKHDQDEEIIHINYGDYDSDQSRRERNFNSLRHRQRREKIEKLKKQILSDHQNYDRSQGFSDEFILSSRKLAVNKDPKRRNQSMLNSRKNSNILLVA